MIAGRREPSLGRPAPDPRVIAYQTGVPKRLILLRVFGRVRDVCAAYGASGPPPRTPPRASCVSMCAGRPAPLTRIVSDTNATCARGPPRRLARGPGRRADAPRSRRLVDRRRHAAARAQRCVGGWATRARAQRGLGRRPPAARPGWRVGRRGPATTRAGRHVGRWPAAPCTGWQLAWRRGLSCTIRTARARHRRDCTSVRRRPVHVPPPGSLVLWRLLAFVAHMMRPATPDARANMSLNRYLRRHPVRCAAYAVAAFDGRAVRHGASGAARHAAARGSPPAPTRCGRLRSYLAGGVRCLRALVRCWPLAPARRCGACEPLANRSVIGALVALLDVALGRSVVPTCDLPNLRTR
jgi:hypothetical protein